MKPVKHLLIRIGAGAMAAAMMAAGTACSADGEQIEVRQAFNQAILDEDYGEAQRIFERSSYQAEFDDSVYVQMIRNRLYQLQDRFENNIITYDQAVVQMEQLMLTDAIEAAMSEDRMEIILDMNTLVAASARKSLAAELSSMGANREAILMYRMILDDEADDAEAARGLQQASNAFVGEIQQETAALRGGRYFNQALVLVRSALDIVPGHQDLLTLQAALEEDQRNADLSLDTRRALVEIRQYMAQNLYQDALLRIKQTKEDPAYQDKLDELNTLEEQVSSIISHDVLQQAALLTPGQDLEAIHWETRPFEEALAVVREGLQILPENETMLQAEAYYEGHLPYNFRDFVRFERGRQQSLLPGTLAFDYEYPDDRTIFNLPLYVVGATQLELDNVESRHESAPWNTLRLVVSPEGDPAARSYQDYQLEVLGDGRELAAFRQDFRQLEEPLVYELNIEGVETIEISLVRDTFFGWLGSGGSEPFLIEGYLSNRRGAPDLPEAAQPDAEETEPQGSEETEDTENEVSAETAETADS